MKVAIHADSYAEIGTGHVMRCIALGQGIQDRGGEVVFITYCGSEGLVGRLRSEGFTLQLLSEPGRLKDLLGLLDKERPHWVVLDGYHFEAGYQRAVKDAGYRLLVIDDYVRLDYYHADIVLNQNYGAEEFRYNVKEGSKLLLGTKYVMLRKEFLRDREFDRKIPEFAENVLITMGGADPDNNTLKILKALNFIKRPLNVKVVVGAANPHYEVLAKEVEGSSHNFEILRGVEDMAPLMARADAAISAGGSTVWELAFMGLPAILSVVADNQEYSVNCLVRDDVFMSLGRPSETRVEGIAAVVQKLLYDAAKRTAMLGNCQKIVDGKGVDRVVDDLMQWPLRILFLGGTLSNDLSRWLEARGEKVFYTEEKVDARYVADLKPDMIISYNYQYMLGKDILCIPQKGAINLHISYLPWNRGAHPNVWSFIEGSPKGVTIHYIDDGIDTGDILVQEEVIFDDDRDTLMSSYAKLHKAIQDLFKRNWAHMRGGSVEAKPQPTGGTLHFRKDSSKFEALISEKAWNTPVKEIREKCKHVRIS
jgi:UDP-2,4-diacetamido-2,4,6-trideoxy-beta-L-altropyranose hydrolase